MLEKLYWRIGAWLGFVESDKPVEGELSDYVGNISPPDTPFMRLLSEDQ